MAAGMSQPAVHSQLASALEAVISLTRDDDGTRRVSEVAMLARGPDGRVEAVPAITFAPGGAAREHEAAERLTDRLGDRQRR